MMRYEVTGQALQISHQHIQVGAFDQLVGRPLVSVSVAVYNHKKFLKKCLDSILCQETDFEFEVIVADDCSDDGTRDLLLDYQKLNPSRIVTCLADKNLWKVGRHVGLTPWYATRQSRGRYLMFLNGDDYLASPSYLQKAIGFLEGCPDYNLHFCNALYEAASHHTDGSLYIKNEPCDRDFTFEELAEKFVPPTAGLIIRLPNRDFFDYAWCTTSKVQLIGWCLTALGDGKARFSADAASVYRVHELGVATTEMHTGSHVDDLIAEFGMLYGMLDEQFGFRKHDALMNGLRSNVRRLIESYLRHSNPRILAHASWKRLINALWRKLVHRFLIQS